MLIFPILLFFFSVTNSNLAQADACGIIYLGKELIDAELASVTVISYLKYQTLRRRSLF